MLTELERAYLAGFVDADGCIAITKSTKGKYGYCGLSVHITQTKREVLDYWQRKVGLGGIYIMCKGGDSANTSFQWVIYGKEAEEFIVSILQHLILKRRQADIALVFRKTIGPQGGKGGRLPPHILRKREECRKAIARLNGRKKIEVRAMRLGDEAMGGDRMVALF